MISINLLLKCNHKYQFFTHENLTSDQSKLEILKKLVICLKNPTDLHVDRVSDKHLCVIKDNFNFDTTDLTYCICNKD